MNEITIADKIYISAKRAAEITGYARDYVGQLCREGHIEAKMVGRSWYVYEPSIRAHRFGTEETPVTSKTKDEGVQTKADSVAEKADFSAFTTDASAATTDLMGTNSSVDTWQEAKYTSEPAEMIPEIQVPAYKEHIPAAEESLTDMQSAWREWFELKQQTLAEPEIETPEIIDARQQAYEAAHANDVEFEEETEVEEDEDEDEIQIPLHRLEDEQEYQAVEAQQPLEEENVPIRSISASQEAVPVRRSIDTVSYANKHVDMPDELQSGRIIEERIIPKGTKRPIKQKAKTQSHAPMIALLFGISLITIAIALIGTGFADKYIPSNAAENNPIIKFLVGTSEYNRQ